MGEIEKLAYGLAAMSRRILEGVIVGAVLLWIVYWVLLPLHEGSKFLVKVDNAIASQFLGVSGSVLVFQAIPVILAAILSLVVIELRKTLPHYNRNKKGAAPERLKRNIWKTLVFIRSPVGILNVADLTFMAVVLFLTFWPFAKSTAVEFGHIDNEPSFIPRYEMKLFEASIYLARSALVPFSLLWIPVSRGSPLLRLIGVPWEQAIRYHTWLAQLAVILFTAHSATFIAALKLTHAASTIFKWNTDPGAALVAGFCALIVFLIMWITALPFIRRKAFEVFYYAHHLYVPALILISLHNVLIVYYYVFPALLFFIDRLMRFLQSRKSVDVLSAKVLPSGAIELKFAKPTSLTYPPLSTVLVNLPSISKLQWHPFSVTSSSLDAGQPGLSICVKPVGGWTSRLHEAILNSGHQQRHQGTPNVSCPFSFKAAVEGPYGDETDFYLKHKSLILVAGGNGITPFLAMLRDILHRYRLQQHKYTLLPESIELYFCVRNPSELAILNTIDPNEILPNWERYLKVHVHAFITSKALENYPDIDDSNENENVEPSGTFDLGTQEAWRRLSFGRDPLPLIHGDLEPAHRKIANRQVGTISPVNGAGSSLWVFAAVFATFVGFILFWGLANVKLGHKIDDPNYKNYKESLYFLGSFALAVGAFGGSVVLLWSFTTFREREINAKQAKPVEKVEQEKDIENYRDSSTWEGELHVGKRPPWQDEFSRLGEQFQGENVAVLVSGPAGLTAAVARACQKAMFSKTSFHFHSVSFQL